MFARIAVTVAASLLSSIAVDVYYNSDFHANLRARRIMNDEKKRQEKK